METSGQTQTLLVSNALNEHVLFRWTTTRKADNFFTVAYTYSIDLSSSWTTSDVEPAAFSNPSDMVSIKQPMMWYNKNEDLVHIWGGLPYDITYWPGSYIFTPAEDGGVSWSNISVPATSGSTLEGLWGSAWAASPSALYSVNGLVTLNDYFPVSGLVTNDFDTDVWTNTTIVSGEESHFSVHAQMQYVPNFGENGVLVAFGGDFSIVQLFSALDGSSAPMSLINIYDIGNEKWYAQETTGDAPPSVNTFCSVGVQSDNGASFEM